MKEELFRQSLTPIGHPGNSYFLLAISSSSDVCLGLKKMERLAMQLWIFRTVKVKLMLTKTIFTWFPSLDLWEDKDKRGTDTVQTPLLSSHAEEVKGRERRAALSPWRKCRHGGSALTLLTCRFLNMRSFWTADLNITALWEWNRSNGAFYSPNLDYKTSRTFNSNIKKSPFYSCTTINRN